MAFTATLARFTELGEIDRVEVLRGPQGTLFGRNASAGLIHVITKRPSFDLGGFAELSYGNYNAIRAAGAITGPISEQIAFRIDGVYSRRDGFYDVVNAASGLKIMSTTAIPDDPRHCCSSPTATSRSA